MSLKIMYPLATQLDYTELRYSLRSVEKFVRIPFEIIIVGDILPDWINNVTFIKLGDIRGKKQLSIRRKILASLEYVNEIAFFNDDVYLLKPTTEFPYYWHGMLKPYQEGGTRQVEKQLQEQGKPQKLFDGHYPLIYKQDFKEASEHFSEDCIIKSLYCNYHNIEGVFTPDCKLLKAMKPEEIYSFIKDKPCFSTGTPSLQSSLAILQVLFKNKSNFEI